jgi:uncharacterized protein (DUF1697 family)
MKTYIMLFRGINVAGRAETSLGVATTARNLNTVTRILQLAEKG